MRPGDIEERDGLVNGPARRRGAGLNPGNRFENVRLHVLGEERERQRQERLTGDGEGGDGESGKRWWGVGRRCRIGPAG